MYAINVEKLFHIGERSHWGVNIVLKDFCFFINILFVSVISVSIEWPYQTSSTYNQRNDKRIFSLSESSCFLSQNT